LGAIKDVIDLLTQLTTHVQDRKLAAELNTIQLLILKLQGEHAALHETNIELREERLALMERIQVLESQIKEISSPPPTGPNDVPTCPNCSTSSKPFFMRPVPIDFVDIMSVTHECPKCHYNTTIKE
jgi:cob(I)alamin adenosyltransferase